MLSPRKFVKAIHDKKNFGNKLELEVLIRKELGPSITKTNKEQALALAQQFIQDKNTITANGIISCPRCGTHMKQVKLSASNALYCPKDRVIFPVV